MARDCMVKEVLGELCSLGIEGRIQEGRKHYKVLFEVGGRHTPDGPNDTQR